MGHHVECINFFQLLNRITPLNHSLGVVWDGCGSHLVKVDAFNMKGANSTQKHKNTEILKIQKGRVFCKGACFQTS